MESILNEKFFRVYANLPIGLRDQIVTVLPEVGPMSWNAVYIEVSNNTKIGKTIIERLIALKII
ncbi:MAG: hypothetical protein AAB453_00655 [Patescibacteria group bacterium]